MTPEERLEEAHKQIGLAIQSELADEVVQANLEDARDLIRRSHLSIEMAREETDDAEVIDG